MADSVCMRSIRGCATALIFMSKLGRRACRFSDCAEMCVIVHHHLPCYQMEGRVILDKQFSRHFTQPQTKRLILAVICSPSSGTSCCSSPSAQSPPGRKKTDSGSTPRRPRTRCSHWQRSPLRWQTRWEPLCTTDLSLASDGGG